MIIIGRHLIRKVLNNYIYMISTTTIDKNKILTKNIISNNITCNGCLIFKYATENVSIGIHDPTTHGEIFNTYSGDYKNVASGKYSHAEGNETKAEGNNSHAEGDSTTASGSCSHAEGYNTTASRSSSHAEGNTTTASGTSSHAEGYNTTASGYYSHAEGDTTTASGDFSHAEGDSTTASGYISHAQNYMTIADYNSMTAIGENNISNTDEVVNKKKNKLFVVGNGTSPYSRQDAFIITEEGNMFISGNLYVKGNIIQEIGDTNWISNDYFNNLN